MVGNHEIHLWCGVQGIGLVTGGWLAQSTASVKRSMGGVIVQRFPTSEIQGCGALEQST